MVEYGLTIRNFSNISDEQLDSVLALTNDYLCCGETILRELLKGRRIIIQRYRFRDSMHRINEAGIQSRRKGRLKRRVYNVKGANHLWHIDTNHKLVKWYLIIFGAIDGYSRLPVSLECISNNKAPTVLACFLKGVHTYGLPSRVRLDEGRENVLVADYMIKERGPGKGSMITGPNTHNQSIDRLWRDVFDGVIGFYYELFSFMEENGILDSFNEVAALHFTFIPLINEKLDAWWQAWSKHRIRTIKTSPLRLWVAGQRNCPLDLMSEDQLRNFGVEGILTDEEIDERLIITSPTDILTEIVLTQLSAEVPFESKPENYGINNFIKAKEIIALFV